MEKLDEIARSTNSGGLQTCPATNERYDAVRRYVNSIPDPKDLPIPFEQDTVISPPNIHLSNANMRQDDRLLNSCRTIGAVVARLPSTMQNEWFALAAKSSKSKRDPTFDELAKFISDKADAAAAQQVYAVGRRFMRPQPNTVRPQPIHKSPLYKAAILTTQIGNDRSGQVRLPVKCAQGGSFHYLDQCPEFIEMPVANRIACVDRLRVCYLCLKPYNQAKVCRSRYACGFQFCVGIHHSLLHRPSSSKTENEPEPPEISSEGVHHSIADVLKSNISLAVVRARIRGPEGDVVVDAFLDNGPSTTLIHSSLLPKLGLNGTPASLIIKTITGGQAEDLNLQLERMFNFEFLEATCTNRAMSLNDRVTYDRTLTPLEIVDGQYQIPLP
ncbi:hypothetical protein X801_04771, partial [Opisthorchis viverrini]